MADELRRRLPEARVVASHEVAPEFREYERASTTAVDAYLGPGHAALPEALGGRVREDGLPEPLVMRSSGGVATLAEAAAHPAFALLSGPAAGVVGAAIAARSAGFENAISFDMGGTSTDVCLIAGGAAERSADERGRGFPSGCRASTCTPSAPAAARSPGSTRAARCTSGLESAGAEPGPACYGAAARADGHRREPPARPAARALAGGLELDRDAAERALGELDPADVVGRRRRDAARAASRLGRARATIRGSSRSSPSAAPGPLHACSLAEELGIETVLVPEAAGVLSALGLAASDERRDHVRSYVVPLAEAGELPAEGEADLPLRAASRSS